MKFGRGDGSRGWVGVFWLVAVIGFGRGEQAMAAEKAVARQKGTSSVVVHSITDLSHEFTFYADGRFFTQYLRGGDNKDSRNWGTLHRCDMTNANVLILMSGATPCPYVDADMKAISSFMAGGGGVVVLGAYGTFRGEPGYALNRVAAAYGALFVSERARPSLRAASKLGATKVETYGGGTLVLAVPDDWDILVRDASGAVLMARRAIGKGSLLLASRALFGHRPDAKDPINSSWVRPLLLDMAKGKSVDPNKPPNPAGWADYDNVVKYGSLELHFSDYLRSEADAIVGIYKECLPVMRDLLGVPPSDGMMSALLLLPTGGGGFSSGNRIGLGIWWGGFPEKRYGMIELIGHEGTHSWVLPFAEPMWNEPIATYVGALVGCRLGYEKEGKGVIAGAIARARKDDPDMTRYDIAYGKNVPNAVVWGKTMWIWEQMRQEKPDILARYFRAKRRLADPKTLKRYTPDDCIAVISHAMERDMFPWFQSLGLSVSAEQAHIAPFHP